MQFPMSSDLLKGWAVLVVDDEPDSLLVAERLLKRCGANVLTAPNGKVGFHLTKQYRPQFIISDLSMPEMSGWEMLYTIKRTPVISHIPIIALTAHAITSDRVRAMEAGFHNYLSKPLQPETFINDLLRLLIDIPEIADRFQ